jgi:putative phosphoesterase
LEDGLRILVVSDVHSNYEALRTVLRDAGSFDACVCAGDTVGYGPYPAECVRLVSSLASSVAGNHDDAVATKDSEWFNPEAREAIAVNRSLIGGSELAWLRALPLSLRLELGGIGIHVFHGSPSDPLTEYIYPWEAEGLLGGYLAEARCRVLVLGHTHVPYVVQSGDGLLINPGSVGQPRDGDPRASYMFLDTISLKVERRRVEYDIEATAGKIIELGIPRIEAERLYRGR